jgi:hypothetical protein
MIFNLLNRNPIARMELAYQRKQKRHFLLNAVLYILPIALGAITLGLYVWLGFTKAEITRTQFSDFALGFGVSVVFAHFGLILRTLYLASSAMGRDKHYPQRWETLLLTGVSARSIIFGKWSAVVQMLWREYLLLGILRTIAVFMTSIRAYPVDDMRFLSLSLMISAGLILIPLTLANLCFTAACGVMTSIQIKQGAVPVAFMVRTVVCVLTVAVPLLYLLIFSWRVIGLETYTPLYIVVMRYTQALFSNGASLVTDLTLDDAFRLRNPSALFEYMGVSIPLYGVLTWMMLSIARWRAEHLGALRPREVKSIP